MKKLVGVVCGGYSGEAAISMKSAAMIMDHIDPDRYEAVRIVIDKQGWYAEVNDARSPIDKNDFSFVQSGVRRKPDVCFVTVHGTPGEDGKLQGYFDLIRMPYTTGGVLNTALTFNKFATSTQLRQLGYRTGAGLVIHHPDELDEALVSATLKYPLFVKPNEGGSSLGVSKVDGPESLKEAVVKAYREESPVLVEEYLTGPEYTCGVLCEKGKYTPLAVTEIETKKEFFDYSGKYDSGNHAGPATGRSVRKVPNLVGRNSSCAGVSRRGPRRLQAHRRRVLHHRDQHHPRTDRKKSGAPTSRGSGNQ